MAIGNNPRLIQELMIGGSQAVAGFAGGGADISLDGSFLTAGEFRIKGDSGGAAGAATPFAFTVHDTGNASAWDIVEPWGVLDFESDDVTGSGAGVKARIGVRMTTTGGGTTGFDFYTDNATSLNRVFSLSRTDEVVDIEALDIADVGLRVHLADGQSGPEWRAFVISTNDNFGTPSGIAFETDSITAATGPAMLFMRTSGTTADLLFSATDADARILLLTLDGSAQAVLMHQDLDLQGGTLQNSAGGLALTIASGEYVFAGGDMQLKGATSRNLDLRRESATIADGELLGSIRFTGDDASAVNTPGCDIRGLAAADWSSGSTPGRLVFRTTPVGSEAPVAAATIGSDKSLTLENFLILPKASTFGIKVDKATPTFGWADILGRVTSVNTGATKPTHTTYRDGLFEFRFAAADEDYFEFHVPHDYVKGTDIFIHVHWSHASPLVTGGTVTFSAEQTYAKGHNQAAFPASVSGTFNGTVSTTRYQQILTEVQLSDSTPTGLQLDTDDLEPDGIIIMTFGLSANNITVSGGGIPEPFIHYVDIHYQTTGLIGTKDKAPDFYA